MRGNRIAFCLAVAACFPQFAFSQFLRGVNVSGAEFGENVIPGVLGTHYTYNSEQTFAYFAARNLRFIRLQVRWERLQPTPSGPLDPMNLALLKQDVAWARAAGCFLSIDAHNYGRYKINENGSLNEYILDNVYNGVVKVSSADLTDFWVRMSNEFKNEPAVLAYDIMNEPHDMGTANWLTISQKVLSGIRANGDNKLVMIPGNSYSSATFWSQVNGSTGWINDPANNYLYEAHLYFDHDYSGSYDRSYDTELAQNPQLPTVGVTRLQPFVNWCNANKAPCYLGEYGTPNDDPRWNVVLDNFLKALDSAGLPGTYWAAGEWWGDYRLSVQPKGDFAIDRLQTPVLLSHLSPGAFTTISAAAAFGYATAPGELASGYGSALAAGTQAASSLPLMTTLQSTQVQITDAAGKISLAPLVLVSAGQINYLVPSSVSPGRADVKVFNSGATVGTGVLEVRAIAPAIFTADNSGQGLAAAQIVRIKSDGTQNYEFVASYDQSQGKFVPLPIRFGGDTLVLLLYGTGFDQSSGARGTSVLIGNRSPAVQYAGPQNQFPGLDQINVSLPASLAGSGLVTVTVNIDGKSANPVTLFFQ